MSGRMHSAGIGPTSCQQSDATNPRIPAIAALRWCGATQNASRVFVASHNWHPGKNVFEAKLDRRLAR
jgi:hypothetical protein